MILLTWSPKEALAGEPSVHWTLYGRLRSICGKKRIDWPSRMGTWKDLTCNRCKLIYRKRKGVAPA